FPTRRSSDLERPPVESGGGRFLSRPRVPPRPHRSEVLRGRQRHGRARAQGPLTPCAAHRKSNHFRFTSEICVIAKRRSNAAAAWIGSSGAFNTSVLIVTALTGKSSSMKVVVEAGVRLIPW